jgi:hypothetical protein
VRLNGITIRIGLTTLLLFLAMEHKGACSGISMTAGIGYEFISQEYFLDSLVEVGGDTLEAITALKTTYLDDIRARISLKYSPYQDRKLELRSDYEQTPEFIRTKLFADYRPRLGEYRLDLTSELDWRNRYADSADAGDDYLFGRARARLRMPLSQSVTANWQIRGDFVSFDSTSTLSYNHYRLGWKAGIGKLFEDFSMFDFNLFYLARAVPDTSELGYVSYGAEAAVLAFHNQGELDVFWRLERKNYRKPEDQSDYWRVDLETRQKLRLGGNYFNRQELNVEVNVFSANELMSNDYIRMGLSLLFGIESGGLSLGLGGDFEMLRELGSEFEESDNYLESGFLVSIDYLSSVRFFGSLESVLGQRNLNDLQELQTDFSFERLNLILDWKLVRGLSLNMLLSGEWEWHQLEEENNQILLVSSGIDYSF